MPLTEPWVDSFLLLLLNLLLLFRDSALDSTIYFCEDDFWISFRDSFELKFGNKLSTFDLFEDAPSTFSYGVDLLREDILPLSDMKRFN